MSIKCQTATDFTIFPENGEDPLAKSIFENMDATENILAAVQFGAGTSNDTSKDARNNLAWERVNNVINFFI